MKRRFEFIAVFCAVDVFKRRAENLHTVFLELICQIDRCLSAKLDDNAFWLFEVNDVHDVFNRQRFEVELVGNGEVS